MSQDDARPTTGLPGLDRILQSLLPGDNVVWQVDAIAEYAAFVRPFSERTLAGGRRLVYFRFAHHPPLVGPGGGAVIRRLSPEVGFESFTTEIHRVIAGEGHGVHYVFDCLSDLATDWYSDLMLGNFFMVTCPYLYELGTVTYFGLIRDHHSFDAVAAIRNTTQVLIDVYHDGEAVYVHPLKVDRRGSPTMYLPHRYEDGEFRALTESSTLADLLVRCSEMRPDAATRRLDIWYRKGLQVWAEADEAREAGVLTPEAEQALVERLLRMMVSRDERVIRLALRYLRLADMLPIWHRMIGTGLVGGKSAGMLIARAILRATDPGWAGRLETHDSYFIGSDVFYTYLVRNGCWHVRRNQRRPETLLDGAAEARERILAGAFPASVVDQIIDMLEYFGQSPIIVRSSSLLEDSFGNAFTGKYESVFCPNQGAPEERLAGFLAAVRRVYASTMSEAALRYRAHRGLLESDEQMAILVQRVSGAVYGHLFYPQVAGVALSYNPYVWSEQIDPYAGVLRLVFGLGTRAVERADDDYTRIVALNAPLRRPETTIDEMAEYAQHRVDVLDLAERRFRSLPANDVIRASPGLPVEIFASPRRHPAEGTDARAEPRSWVLTFDRLLSETPLVADVRRMLDALREAYAYHVDLEITANFLADGSYRINLVQCRPLQVKEGGSALPELPELEAGDILLELQGTIIGPSSFTQVDRVIYVVPSAYGRLSIPSRYSVARLVGRLTHARAPQGRETATVLLIGPGRWGTSTPSLGVPVAFAEIDTVSILCEIVAMADGIVPDVSLGSHFFNDLVEANMLYLALYPGRPGNRIREHLLLERRNRLPDLLPYDADWAEVVRVVDFPDGEDGRALYCHADCLAQRCVIYLAAPSGGEA